MNVTQSFARARAIAQKFRNSAGWRPKDGQLWLSAKKQDTKQDTGQLYIYDGIGESFWGSGITSKDVVDQLEKLKDVKYLDVFINSEGGDVFEGKAIYNSLKRFSAQKTIHIDGLAASAASFIAMAGDKIITAENATWMIHEAWGIAGGRAEDLRAMADVLDGENDAIAGIYAARTKQPLDTIKGWLSEEKWFGAKDALALGFTDEMEQNFVSGDEEAVSAKLPAVTVARQTKECIAAHESNALLLARMNQSILRNTSNRASPASRDGQPSPKGNSTN